MPFLNFADREKITWKLIKAGIATKLLKNSNNKLKVNWNNINMDVVINTFVKLRHNEDPCKALFSDHAF